MFKRAREHVRRIAAASGGGGWLLLLLAPSTFFFNEFLIYYLTISQCRWSISDHTNSRFALSILLDAFENDALSVMVLADTHLLGVQRGHWFDKLRR